MLRYLDEDKFEATLKLYLKMQIKDKKLMVITNDTDRVWEMCKKYWEGFPPCYDVMICDDCYNNRKEKNIYSLGFDVHGCFSTWFKLIKRQQPAIFIFDKDYELSKFMGIMGDYVTYNCYLFKYYF